MSETTSSINERRRTSNGCNLLELQSARGRFLAYLRTLPSDIDEKKGRLGLIDGRSFLLIYHGR